MLPHALASDSIEHHKRERGRSGGITMYFIKGNEKQKLRKNV
jgi:hypothetical protein